MGKRAVRLGTALFASLVLAACAPDGRPDTVVSRPVPAPTGFPPGPTLAPPEPLPSRTTVRPPSPTVTKIRKALTEPTRTAPYYRSCAAAERAGDVPLKRGRDAGYRLGLDRDHDGIACDQ